MTNDVGLELVIAVLGRPEVQGKAGQLIDFGNGKRIASQVYQRKVGSACVARLKAQVRELRGGEAGKPGFSRLAAAGATAARKRAAAQAEGTDHIKRETLAPGTQAPDLWRLPAPGALLAGRKTRRIRLQDGPGEKIERGRGRPPIPIRFDESASLTGVELLRGAAEQCRSGPCHEIQQQRQNFPEFRKGPRLI